MARLSIAIAVCVCLATTVYAPPPPLGAPSPDFQTYLKVKSVMMGGAVKACDNAIAQTHLIPIKGDNETHAACVNVPAEDADAKKKSELGQLFKSAKIWKGGIKTFKSNDCSGGEADFPTTMPDSADDVPGYLKMFEGMMMPPNYDATNEGTCELLGTNGTSRFPNLGCNGALSEEETVSTNTVKFLKGMFGANISTDVEAELIHTGKEDILKFADATSQNACMNGALSFGFNRKVSFGVTPPINGGAGFYWQKRYTGVEKCKDITATTPFNVQTTQNECIAYSELQKFAVLTKLMMKTMIAGGPSQEEMEAAMELKMAGMNEEQRTAMAQKMQMKMAGEEQYMNATLAAFDMLIDAGASAPLDNLYLSTRCCVAGPFLATFTDAKCTKMAHPGALTDTKNRMIEAAKVVYQFQVRKSSAQGCSQDDDGLFVGGGCPVVMPKDETSDTGKQNCSAIKASVQQQKIEVRDDGWAATKIAVVYGSDCPSSQQ